MKKTLALLALAASLAIPGFAADKAEADNGAKGYPAVSAAIKATENAIAALGRVKADLGAHQAAASAALNTALTELKAGLDGAKATKAAKGAEKKAAKAASAPAAPADKK
jgi:hypothetical protein